MKGLLAFSMWYLGANFAINLRHVIAVYNHDYTLGVEFHNPMIEYFWCYDPAFEAFCSINDFLNAPSEEVKCDSPLDNVVCCTYEEGHIWVRYVSGSTKVVYKESLLEDVRQLVF